VNVKTKKYFPVFKSRVSPGNDRNEHFPTRKGLNTRVVNVKKERPLA